MQKKPPTKGRSLWNSVIQVYQKTGNWHSTQQEIDNYHQSKLEEAVQRRLAEEKEKEAMWGQQQPKVKGPSS